MWIPEVTLTNLLCEIDVSHMTLAQFIGGAIFTILSGGGLGAWITARSARGTGLEVELGKVREGLREDVGKQDTKIDELHADISALERAQSESEKAQAKKDAAASYQMRTIQRFVRKVKRLLEGLQSGEEYRELISDADEILTFPCDPPPSFAPNAQHPSNPPP